MIYESWFIGLLIYLALLTIAGFLAFKAKKNESPEEHFIAGRSLGIITLFFTIYATAFSGNTLIGHAGQAYRTGFIWVLSVGFQVAIPLFFLLLAPKLYKVSNKKQFLTPGDWIRFRFYNQKDADTLRNLISLLMIIAVANFLFAQMKAMGEITELISNYTIPYELCVFGLAVVILGYETFGGMRAVAWTDIVQGIIMLLGLGFMLYWILSVQGLEQIGTDIARLKPELTMTPSKEKCINWVSTIFLVGFGVICYPQMLQRVFAAKNIKSLKNSFMLMSFMPFTTTAVVFFIGLAAIPKFLNLNISGDQVFPQLLNEISSLGLFAKIMSTGVFIACLAAIMSTADSILLSLGSLITRDLFNIQSNDVKATKFGKKVIILLTFVTATLALYRDITLWRLIELKLELLVQCAPTILFALYFKKLKAKALVFGIYSGVSVLILGLIFQIKTVYGLHLGLLSFIFNLAVSILGSKLINIEPSIENIYTRSSINAYSKATSL